MDKKRRMKAGGDKGTMILAILIILVTVYAISWAITCGLIWIIAVCFDLAFSWSVATGIWIVLLILKSAFKAERR